MKRIALLLALLVLPALAVPPEAPPRRASERVVLRTQLGDVVLALFPDEAPETVKQVLALVRAGVYDTTHFFKVNPSFFLQVSGTARRRLPLTPDQAALVHPLKAEINRLHHHQGRLVMAHDVGQPDNAESSFLILLREVPQMNGLYTVFGEVESGWETLEAIRRFPANAQHEPLTRLEIFRAEVAPDAASLPALGLQGPNPGTPFLIVSLALLAAGAAGTLWAFRRNRRELESVSRVAILTGAFLVFTALAPRAASSPGLGPALLLGLLIVFKLMSDFERAPS
jgi:cyclophilin family peptidyl-prolyl cis-trans isomerase